MVEDRSSPTPEKQLLKLIEEPSGPAAGAHPARRRGPSFSFGALRSRLSFWQKGFGQAFSGGVTLNIKKVNGLLLTAAFVLGIFFVASSAVLAHRLSELPNFSFSPTERSPGAKFVLPTRVQSLETYAQMARARDIFQLGAIPVPPSRDFSAPTQEASQRERAELILSRYRLVGISWADDPDAMIENTTDAKTYFIKRGHYVDGIRVEAIYKDRVILRDADVEVELR